MQGDIGYVESDRNPFLHSRKIKEAPFDAVVIKISGTSETGVLAAVVAFRAGLINGLVPTGQVVRTAATILDLDPLSTPAPMELPGTIEVAGGTALLAGWSQVPANEYRAYLDLGQPEPLHVWRYKYLFPGALDRAGVVGWMNGMHRMAYGNAVTLAEFRTADEARKAAAAVGKTSGFRKVGDIAGLAAWEAEQPTDESLKTSLGSITVLAKDRFLIMSALPKALMNGFVQQCLPRD